MGRAAPALALAGSAIAVCTAIAVLAAYLVGVRYNLTPSMPRGFYVASDTVAVGSIVAGCLPASLERLGVSRGYLTPGFCPGGGAPVIKRVAGLASARYEVTSAGVFVDRKRVGGAPSRRDHAGRALYAARRGVVSVNEAFVLGVAADSWDSRYFGPVPLAGLHRMRVLLETR